MEDISPLNPEQIIGIEKKHELRQDYEKPTITKQEEMTFMYSPLSEINSKYVCRQCSSCHGCR